MRLLGQAYADEDPIVGADGGAAAVPSRGGFTVEEEQRLSRSVLWQAQRRYFHEQGIDAWRTATVPHYVTSNPALAHAYAEVVVGFMRDVTARGCPEGPIHIVELGAGSGRFGYLFLKALLDVHARSPVRHVPFKYVMTDFTETNVAFFRAHEALAPLVEGGVLDFAIFDVEEGSEIRLLESGETLAPGGGKGPMVVIANYVFDGVSQDAMSFEDGRLHECLVSLRAARPENDPSDPSLLSRVEADFVRRPAPEDYYPEAEFNDILRDYARDLDGATILFPCTALRCIDRLSKIASGPLLLISGDKGGTAPEDLRERDDAPRMDVHGSFSLMVNYHAIAAYVARRGGEAMMATKAQPHLTISSFVLGAPEGGAEETRFAFEQSIDRAGPDDFFSLRRGVQTDYARLDLEHLVSLVRLGHHDPKILRDCLPAMRDKLAGASAALTKDLLGVLLRTWENHYHIGEEADLAFAIGVVLHELGAIEEATSMFESSARLHGDDAATHWNMAMCHAALGRIEDAARCLAASAAAGSGLVGPSPLREKGAAP